MITFLAVDSRPEEEAEFGGVFDKPAEKMAEERRACVIALACSVFRVPFRLRLGRWIPE